MLNLSGKLLQAEEIRPQGDQGKPHTKLHILGRNGKGPQIYQVKDYSGQARKLGEDVNLQVAAKSYVFNGSHGISFTHYGNVK